jgi:hypothetical protein
MLGPITERNSGYAPDGQRISGVPVDSPGTHPESQSEIQAMLPMAKGVPDYLLIPRT